MQLLPGMAIASHRRGSAIFVMAVKLPCDVRCDTSLKLRIRFLLRLSKFFRWDFLSNFELSYFTHRHVSAKTALRCVYAEYDEIFRTYSDVGYEIVRGYDVKLLHYPRHSRIQLLEALQNNR